MSYAPTGCKTCTWKCVFVVDLLKINPFVVDTYLKVKYSYFGFSTEEQLKNLLHQDKIVSADSTSFKKEASNMVVAIVEKITEKRTLHFSVDRNVNVFDSNVNDHCRTN